MDPQYIKMSPSSFATTSWGIVSTANIAKKVINAITNSKYSITVAIGSRNKDHATQWVKENGISIDRIYGSYLDVLRDTKVQVVYVPLPTSLKYVVVKQAAEHGKSVLVEKPFTNASDLRLMMEACSKHGVALMDGTMFMHHTPRINTLLHWLGYIQVIHMTSMFTYPIDDETNIRYNADLEPLGALGDLGWYNVKITLLAFGWTLPISVCCNVIEWSPHDVTTGKKVPIQCSCLMIFANGRSASFICGFKTSMRQWVEFCGLTETLRIEDFVLPGEGGLPEGHLRRFGKLGEPLDDLEITDDIKDTTQESMMVDTMSSCAAAPETSLKWQEEALLTQITIDTLFKSACNDGAITMIPTYERKG